VNSISVSSVVSVTLVAFCSFTVDFLVRNFAFCEILEDGSMNLETAGTDWEEQSSGVQSLFPV